MIAEVQFNRSSILNNFKSLLKKEHQKEQTQNIKKKKYQNNYLRAEISRKKHQLLRLKVKNKIDF